MSPRVEPRDGGRRRRRMGRAALALVVVQLALVVATAGAQVVGSDAGTPSRSAGPGAAALQPSPTPSPEPSPSSTPEPTGEGGPTAATPSAAEAAPDVPSSASVPTARGLPVVVRVAVQFIDVETIDENEGAFEATIDLRLQWDDARLGDSHLHETGAVRELRGSAAEARIEGMWVPDVRVANLDGEPSHRARGLWISPRGHVELVERITGRFASAFDVERFPFDRQKLVIELLSERDASETVTLDYRQDDLDFSRVSTRVAVEGWEMGLVSISRQSRTGWHSATHEGLAIALEVERESERAARGIFIPLFASLLIPLLAMWLNRYGEGEYKIEAFELANVVVGGLFAVIALNFTINSEYPVLASGDNAVARLFALNYVTLGVSLVINLVLFRFAVARRFLGPYVEEQAYVFLSWAVPLLALGTAMAVVLAAAV